MEAIQPGSSTVIRSPNAYETVSSFAEDDRYSYARHMMHEPRPPSTVIYDEPDVPIGSLVKSNPPAEYDDPILIPGPVQAQIEPEVHPPTEVEYDEPIQPQASRRKQSTKSSTRSLIQSQSQKELQSHKEDSDDDYNDEIYCDVPEELVQDDAYIEIVQTADLPAPRRNATIPKELNSIAEISLENLSNLNPMEAQLWMLLHMQKMVQKMEEVYDSPQPLSPRANKNPITKPSTSLKPAELFDKAKVPAPPSSPPSEEIEEIYDEDIGPELELAAEPTRKDLYVNLDTLSEAITESPPPPIPPRTHQHASEDVASTGYRSRTQSEIPSQDIRQAPSASKPDRSKSYATQSQQSKTLLPALLTQSCSSLVPGLGSVRQKRETSNEEMISKCKHTTYP